MIIKTRSVDAYITLGHPVPSNQFVRVATFLGHVTLVRFDSGFRSNLCADCALLRTWLWNSYTV